MNEPTKNLEVGCAIIIVRNGSAHDTEKRGNGSNPTWEHVGAIHSLSRFESHNPVPRDARSVQPREVAGVDLSLFYYRVYVSTHFLLFVPGQCHLITTTDKLQISSSAIVFIYETQRVNLRPDLCSLSKPDIKRNASGEVRIAARLDATKT